MTTLAAMKERIAREIRRDDLTVEIAEAIAVAIDAYKYRRFAFNVAMFVDAPAGDLTADNAWMTTAEALIRHRAKAEIYAHIIRKPEMADMLAGAVNEALERLRLSVEHNTIALTVAGTLGRMKARIANEIDRADMAHQIADAITTAVAAYRFQRFHFNPAGAPVEAPTTEGDVNAWTNEAEALIRHRAKAELYSVASPIADPAKAAECMAQAEQALAELRVSRTHQTTTNAGTRARMKQRIANEIERSDLQTEIAEAIEAAIGAYQGEEFRFNEQRITFSTEVDKEFYTEADVAALGTLEKIEYLKIYISDVPSRVSPMMPSAIEAASTNGIMRGDPVGYCWYDQTLRLYPVPSTVRTMVMGAKVAPASPLDDDEADNPWMIDAERLIRSRAKMELALHVLSNTTDKAAQAKAANLAAAMQIAVDGAFDQLKSQYTRMGRAGAYTVEPMEF